MNDNVRMILFFILIAVVMLGFIASMGDANTAETIIGALDANPMFTAVIILFIIALIAIGGHGILFSQ